MTGKIRHPKKRAFLAAYSECCRVGEAAKLAGIDRDRHYEWLRDDSDYRDTFEATKELVCQQLEDEAVRRAREGVDEPVFYQGEECGTIRRYSDTLLIFIMKGAMPAKYRENRSIELSGPGGAPIEIDDAKHKLTERLGSLAIAEPD